MFGYFSFIVSNQDLYWAKNFLFIFDFEELFNGVVL